ncbi:MAG: hypothetical protein HeimC3_12720 [Candidatus Heimdallarchaeota archaeon LC_3]|nr:MAG: hypothetical protein HeimC3_12720 [Candidatus Heimdallarchaeota archaeon LC_3]
MMDLTAGLYLVTSDPSKPRLIINLGQNNVKNNKNQITIEIDSKTDSKILFNIIDNLNSFIRSIKYHWEVCSLTGEVLDDNFNNLNNKLTKSLLFKILDKFISNSEEIKINYSFSIGKDQFEIKSSASISPEEENMIAIIKNRFTRSIQSGMVKKDPKFDNYTKNEILIILRTLVEKKILERSGSWFFLKKS